MIDDKEYQTKMKKTFRLQKLYLDILGIGIIITVLLAIIISLIIEI